MARSCAICGKVSMGGFNPQSSGMNRVRAHRRMKPNLQPLVIEVKGTPDQVARLHPLPAHAAQVGQVAVAVTRRLDSTPGPVARRPVSSCAARAGYRSAVSSQIVNGPSLTSSTAISAPNRPVATVTPRPRSASAKRR